jgi:adenylate kinase
VIWINGTFGVGKTTVAQEVLRLLPESRLFDPESVGVLVAQHLPDRTFTDFQQLPLWRRLVPVVAEELARFTGQGLVAVQTVLVEQYWIELRAGLAETGLRPALVLLDAEPEVVRDRILGDDVEGQAERWRLDHLAVYAAARPWLVQAADLVVDTGESPPERAAARIVERLSRTVRT